MRRREQSEATARALNSTIAWHACRLRTIVLRFQLDN